MRVGRYGDALASRITLTPTLSRQRERRFKEQGWLKHYNRSAARGT